MSFEDAIKLRCSKGCTSILVNKLAYGRTTPELRPKCGSCGATLTKDRAPSPHAPGASNAQDF